MNLVILKGRIGNDLKITGSENIKILKFSLAVNDGYGDKKKTYWINCTAFNKTAEIIATYFQKGSEILINGKITTSKYENSNGETKYFTDVIVNEFHFVESKKKDYEPWQKDSFIKEDITFTDEELIF